MLRKGAVRQNPNMAKERAVRGLQKRAVGGLQERAVRGLQRNTCEG